MTNDCHINENDAFIVISKHIYSDDKEDLKILVKKSKVWNPFIISYYAEEEKYPIFIYAAYGKAYRLNIQQHPLSVLLYNIRNNACLTDLSAMRLFAINIKTYELKFIPIEEANKASIDKMVKKAIPALEEFEI